MEGRYQCQLLLQEWIDTTAEFLKSLDSNHLVTVGSEGFLGSSTPGKSELFLDVSLRETHGANCIAWGPSSNSVFVSIVKWLQAQTTAFAANMKHAVGQ